MKKCLEFLDNELKNTHYNKKEWDTKNQEIINKIDRLFIKSIIGVKEDCEEFYK